MPSVREIARSASPFALAVVHGIDARDCEAGLGRVVPRESHKAGAVLAVATAMAEQEQTYRGVRDVEARRHVADEEAFFEHEPRMYCRSFSALLVGTKTARMESRLRRGAATTQHPSVQQCPMAQEPAARLNLRPPRSRTMPSRVEPEVQYEESRQRHPEAPVVSAGHADQQCSDDRDCPQSQKAHAH